jgi:hypothetical protein
VDTIRLDKTPGMVTSGRQIGDRLENLCKRETALKEEEIMCTELISKWTSEQDPIMGKPNSREKSGTTDRPRSHRYPVRLVFRKGEERYVPSMKAMIDGGLARLIACRIASEFARKMTDGQNGQAGQDQQTE